MTKCQLKIIIFFIKIVTSPKVVSVSVVMVPERYYKGMIRIPAQG